MCRLQVSHCLSPGEYVLFFDRLALVRKCKQLTGAELTTRTNVLLVRQSLVTPGNGVVFTYRSKKNTKRSHHQGQSPSPFEDGGVCASPDPGSRLDLFTRQIATCSSFRRAASSRIQRRPTRTTAAGSSSTPLRQ